MHGLVPGILLPAPEETPLKSTGVMALRMVKREKFPYGTVANRTHLVLISCNRFC